MPDSKSLITLVQEFGEIERYIIGNDGEVSPALEEFMDLHRGELSAKVDGYKLFMDFIDSRAAYLKDIEGQYYAARKALENQKECMKGNLKFAMNAMKTEDLEGTQFRFKLSKPKPKLAIDMALLDDYWKKEEVKMVADADLIQKYLDEGSDIPGVTVESSQTLRSYVNAAGKAKPVKEVAGG